MEDKISIWVDDKNHIRQARQTEFNNGQEIEIHATVEYDIAIDPNHFSPEFDSNIKLANVRQLIEKQYPLDSAIFTRNSLGFVFAVHKLQRYKEGFKLLVCSNRLSDLTRKEIETGNPWTYYGEPDLYSRWQSVADGEYSDDPRLLARMKHDGIQVDWYLLIPAGDKTKETFGCDVDIIVNTANELKEYCKARGLPVRDEFRLNLPVQKIKDSQVTLREIVNEIYSLGEKFDPLVHSFLLTQIVTERNGEKVQAWRRIVELSQENYFKDVEQRIQEWLKRNK
jgi:hypothetical protein